MIGPARSEKQWRVGITAARELPGQPDEGMPKREKAEAVFTTPASVLITAPSGAPRPAPPDLAAPDLALPSPAPPSRGKPRETYET